MPDGTAIDPSFTDGNISGTSSLTAIMNGLGHDDALAAIQRCLDRWSAAANVYFVQVSDNGTPFNGTTAHGPNTGEIRFGAFAITGGVGAVGYAPPPNGGSLEGDLLLNSDNTFFFDSSSEGEPIHIYNDFESLIMHELGHALGMAHADPGVQAAMSADPNVFQYVNRELDADDIAGSQFLYGPGLTADFHHENGVHSQDLAIWKTNFGAAVGVSQVSGDATRDGRVDGADFLAWQREASSGGAPALGVPEPTTYVAVLTALFALMAADTRVLRSAR
jgi:hypothetical protein